MNDFVYDGKLELHYAERNIVETIQFDGKLVMMWGYVSYNCNLDLAIVRCNLKTQHFQFRQ